MILRRRALVSRRRQRGVYAMLYAILLLPLTAMIGLAELFNRQHELRNIADRAVVAEACTLDGPSSGIREANNRAAAANQYRFPRPLAWTWSVFS